MSPSKVKNHDLLHVEFSHNLLTGKNGYKVTPTVLLDLVTHHVQRHLDKRTLPSQDKLHDTPSKVLLDLDTLNSLITKAMKREHLTKMLLNTS